MKTLSEIKIDKKIVVTFFMMIISVTTMAQVKYWAKNDLNLVVSGTSTLHDWDMKAAKGDCEAVFTINASGHPTALTSLNFVTPAESLKSEHSGMDKNAYKALKTTQNPNITYTLTSATIAPDGTIKCMGKLTIAGTTNNADLVAAYKLNADKSITVTGSKKISMKDFKMEPPTFMMGTIKTGNDIVLKFNLTLKK